MGAFAVVGFVPLLKCRYVRGCPFCAVAAGGCAASAFFPIVFWSFWSFSSDEDISTAGPAAFFFMVGILGSYF